MAKAPVVSPTTDVSSTQDAPTEDLMIIPGMEGMISTQRSEGVDEGELGTEGISREDITIPRIALAQKTSPEIDSTQSRFIDGLKFTEMFGSLSRKNFGNGPIYFSILRRDQPRYVKFIPLAEGGGIEDPDVKPMLPDGTPNPLVHFSKEIDPVTHRPKKPVATKFYDFIVLILNDLDFNDPMQNVMALSLKSSAIPVAKQLNLFIQQRGKKKLYRGLYELRSAHDAKDSKVWAIYKVKNAGWLKENTKVDALASEMFESWKDREVKIDTDTEVVEDDTSFDTARMDSEKAEM